MPHLKDDLSVIRNMRSKIQTVSNFSRAITVTTPCFRPDEEKHLREIFVENIDKNILARGNGLSYSDCCILSHGIMIDARRLNHLLEFDEDSGIAVCQGAATFADLFLLSPDFIPPVLPGTLYATLAGGVAHDVHGKNNHIHGSLGRHIAWLELQTGKETFHCSADKNPDLFTATIAGLGLTGVIKRIGIRLQKNTRYVTQYTEKHMNWPGLLQRMQEEGIQHQYQVAWLDLMNEPRAVLSFADHVDCDAHAENILQETWAVPKFPVRLITSWGMKQFNRAYFYWSKSGSKVLPLWKFNNPLDCIKNWNYLYGKKGLLQFQAVFPGEQAIGALERLTQIIRQYKALPTLAVLKYFTRPGSGLLSFVKPGFTLAVDFVHNQQARQAIDAMNQAIVALGGSIYLAKDLFLTRQQFAEMYPWHQEFIEILNRYQSPMASDLSQRLGLTP
ncbi:MULTISPECIES: FAD-binding oxidoreductase [Legionella]|uniref:FAD-binding oxidoreductase n=1 Tax=Legionella TaxID=445 RepID=UPI002D77F20B|nr:FAD-binding oxidoreductase [Legionella septentrionalis]